MTIRIVEELKKLGTARPRRSFPLPVVLPELGTIGYVGGGIPGGLYVKQPIRPHFRRLLREHYRVERMIREASGGALGAGDVLPVIARGTDSRDPVRAAREAIRAINGARAAMASWDDIIAARTAGKSWDYMGTKASQTTVASQWSSFFRTAGNPSAGAHDSAITGGKRCDASTAGAWPLPMTLGGSEHLYLQNLGQNHATGTNITLLVDLLVSAGTISATVNTSQTINTTSLARFTTGAGLAMTLEITTALGATAANLTVNYTDQAGNTGNSVSGIAMTTSGIAGRLQPVQDGPQIRLEAGDYGVRSVEVITLSASMAAGVLALMIYRPLLIMPTIATTSFVERSTPAQVGGIIQLSSAAGETTKPCLTFFVLSSTTSTGVQTYFMQTVWGTP